MAYTYEIEYRRSEEHGNVGALSRLPRTQKDDIAAEQGNLFFLLCELIYRDFEIADDTKKNPVLSKVLQYILEGWPDERQDALLRHVFSKRPEPSADHGWFLWGWEWSFHQ